MEHTVVKPKFKRVCVFCGSSSGNKQVFRNAALDLAQEFIAKEMDLVYGGGNIGLMGIIAQAVHAGGRSVLGIIPSPLVGQGKAGETIGKVKIVAGMHERKAEMARQSDCFIVLPGGYGTLEEMFEMISGAQLGIHDKPIGVLNIKGYYNDILALIDGAVTEGFIKPSQRHLFISATDAKELIQKLEGYEPHQDETTPKLKWT